MTAMHATQHPAPAQPLADCSTATWRALQAYVGRPYEVGAFDCADLAVLVQREVFGRAVHLPTHPQGGAGQRDGPGFSDTDDVAGHAVHRGRTLRYPCAFHGRKPAQRLAPATRCQGREDARAL